MQKTLITQNMPDGKLKTLLSYGSQSIQFRKAGDIDFHSAIGKTGCRAIRS